MDIVPHTADFGSASTSDALESTGVSYSGLGGDTMTLAWLLGTRDKSGQLSVRLPGAGTVRVDVEKHVDKALKGKANGIADGTKPGKPPGASKP